jgi:hypothetical protein
MVHTRVLLYDDENNTTAPYDLRSYLFEVKPTGVAIATLNSPSNLNALTKNLLLEMFVVLEHAARCPDVKACATIRFLILFLCLWFKIFCLFVSFLSIFELFCECA